MCAAAVGCGGATEKPMASEPPSSTATATTALPDLQPVPSVTEPDLPEDNPIDSQALAVFNRWVAAAADNDPEAWTKAEQELQGLGASAVPALTTVLDGDLPLAREMAVMFLAQLGPQAEPAADALAKLLDDESSLVRVNAAGVLTTFETAPESAVLTLTALLTDTDPNIRTTAAGCLGNVPELPPAALRQLAGSLDDPEPSVRTAAATTLSRAGTKAAAVLPKLRQLTADDDETVRQAATMAVRLIDPSQAPAASETVPVGATEER
jgi:HEAT repeat protein